MRSKAPPVPQASPASPEEQTTNKDGDVQEITQNTSAESSEARHPDQSAADGIVEEQNEARPLVAHPVQTSREVPPVHLNEQRVLRNPEQRVVPRQADDRIFTWAAVGLTIAIVVLLLKKFMKANGHGAVFMDES